MSGGVFLIEIYGLNAEVWRFAGREVLPDQFAQIAIIVLTFLLIGHLMTWVADYVAYSKWFKRNEVPADNLGAIGSFSKSTSSIPEALSRRLTRFEDILEYQTRKLVGEAEEASAEKGMSVDSVGRHLEEVNKDIERINDDLLELKSMLDDIGPGWRSIAFTTKMIVFGWHFAIPILTVCAAYYVLLPSAG